MILFVKCSSTHNNKVSNCWLQGVHDQDQDLPPYVHIIKCNNERETEMCMP